MLRFRGSGDIKVAVAEHLRSRGDLAGKRVLDLPAGKGELAALLRECGAEVEAYDLFPEAFEAEGLTCHRIDLREPFPVPDGHADLALFQEAVEHLPDQLHALRELNRVLAPGGTLLLTTPNVSHLRARVSHLLLESDLYNRMPASELDAVWAADGGEEYFGHLFLVGVQRLRVLARLAGFELVRIHPVKASLSSLLLGFLYPLLALAGLFARWRDRARARARGLDPERRKAVSGEMFRLNLHPTVLFGKHLFLELRKAGDWRRGDPLVLKDPRTIR
jgi:SAM-dependent methyltransferase